MKPFIGLDRESEPGLLNICLERSLVLSMCRGPFVSLFQSFEISSIQR